MDVRAATGERARRRRAPLSARHDDAAGKPDRFAKVLFYLGHQPLLPAGGGGTLPPLSGCFESLLGLLTVKADAS